MIATCIHALEQCFSWLLTASWQASVLALLVLGLQWILRGQLNPRWRYALWLLVVVRLLLPALPESALSLFQFAPHAPVSFVAPMTEPLLSQTPLPPSAPQMSPTSDSGYHPFSLYSLLALVWLTGVLILTVLTWQVNWRVCPGSTGGTMKLPIRELLRLYSQPRLEFDRAPGLSA